MHSNSDGWERQKSHAFAKDRWVQLPSFILQFLQSQLVQGFIIRIAASLSFIWQPGHRLGPAACDETSFSFFTHLLGFYFILQLPSWLLKLICSQCQQECKYFLGREFMAASCLLYCWYLLLWVPARAGSIWKGGLPAVSSPSGLSSNSWKLEECCVMWGRDALFPSCPLSDDLVDGR